MKPIFYTPGPSELFYTVPDHLRTALREGIPSINHRSQKFQDVIKQTNNALRELFGLPDDYRIVYTSSATETWERIALNLIDNKAGFVVNGAFSERFAGIAEQWGKKNEIISSEYGSCPDLSSNPFSNDAELIGLTHNETSTGCSIPLEDIYMLKNQYPDSIIAVDIVSSAPIVPIDFTKIDTAYFSVQKGFGLPSGLGVWMFNERCLEKALSLEKKGKITGSYHKLTRLASQIDAFQTPSTPNMLGIYLLGKVANDMLEKGLEMIRRESRYKAALLNHTIIDHPAMEHFVKDQSHRSQTTIVSSVDKSEEWVEKLKEKNIIVGQGYGIYKSLQLRFANFPTHSKEQYERLVDELIKL